MTTFEGLYLCAEPFLPWLHRDVRKRLSRIVRSQKHRPKILDVGGRKSHYTIALPADITISDLPRETEVQRTLNLGINRRIIDSTRRRRSNIEAIVLDDMTQSQLPDESYHCVVAVEVLEHVEEDAQFVKEVCRVLKPGGVFLMTTPNGDYVPNTNADHKRHYTRQQLLSLLQSEFRQVKVDYAVAGGIYLKLGLKSWSLRHPLQTFLSMTGNLVNSVQSKNKRIKKQASGTHHLIATAIK